MPAVDERATSGSGGPWTSASVVDGEAIERACWIGEIARDGEHPMVVEGVQRDELEDETRPGVATDVQIRIDGCRLSPQAARELIGYLTLGVGVTNNMTVDRSSR